MVNPRWPIDIFPVDMNKAIPSGMQQLRTGEIIQNPSYQTRLPGGFGDDGIVLEFFSIVALQTSSLVSLLVDRVRLTFPHGSMILKRQITIPAHLGYVLTVDGAYYVWESGDLVPELLGANPTTGVDNTLIFKNFAVVINAVKPRSIRLAHNAVYDVCSTDAICLAILGAQGVMVQITDTSYFIFDCNGASFRTRFALGTYQPNIWEFTRCTNWVLLNPKGTQDRVVPVPWNADDFLNTYWITAQDGCTDFDIVNMNFFGGTIGFAASYVINSAQARVARGRVTGYCSSVFYPYSLQATGDNMTCDIQTYNAGRSAIMYGYNGVKIRVRSTPSNWLQDIAIEAIGMNPIAAGDNPVSTDIELDYISNEQLQSGGPAIALVNHSAYSAGANHFCIIKGVKIHLDIQNSNNGFNGLIATSSLIDSSLGVTTLGDFAGNRMYEIVIDGNLRANLNGSLTYMIGIGNSYDGFTVNTVIQSVVRDFFAFDCTRNFAVGKYATMLIENVEGPGSAITREAGAEATNVSVVHSTTPGIAGGARYSTLNLV